MFIPCQSYYTISLHMSASRPHLRVFDRIRAMCVFPRAHASGPAMGKNRPSIVRRKCERRAFPAQGKRAVSGCHLRQGTHAYAGRGPNRLSMDKGGRVCQKRRAGPGATGTVSGPDGIRSIPFPDMAGTDRISRVMCDVGGRKSAWAGRAAENLPHDQVTRMGALVRNPTASSGARTPRTSPLLARQHVALDRFECFVA